MDVSIFVVPGRRGVGTATRKCVAPERQEASDVK
jgi:hypothetical protein